MPHRFERAADWVNKFEGPERDAWQKPQTLIAALGDVRGKTVVDLGGRHRLLPCRICRAPSVPAAGRCWPSMSRPIWCATCKPAPSAKGLKRARSEERGRRSQTGRGQRRPRADRRCLAPHSGSRRVCQKLAAALRKDGAISLVDFKLDMSAARPRNTS